MMKISNLDEFLQYFENAEWLEDRNGCQRWSNGLEEGTEYESAWFNSDDNMIDDPYEQNEVQ